jgi:hypothetical protein
MVPIFDAFSEAGNKTYGTCISSTVKVIRPMVLVYPLLLINVLQRAFSCVLFDISFASVSVGFFYFGTVYCLSLYSYVSLHFQFIS